MDESLRFGGQNFQTLKPARPGCGFSLLELMVCVAVLMVIMSAAFSMINYYQKAYGRTQLKADMYETGRGVAELMAQEIGQAGLVNLPAATPTLSSPVVNSGVASSATVSSATSMFVGEQLLVDTGTNEELVALTVVDAVTNSISGIFTKAHAIGTPFNVLGVFPNGVVTGANGSTGTSLRLFGDINAEGSLVYVRYDCDTTAGTLKRSVTTIVPAVNTLSASQTLLNTLVTNPGATPSACFQYTTVTTVGYTFVTNVGVTLSVQTTAPDPQSQQYLTTTISLNNLVPRNVLIGWELAKVLPPITNRLQPTPANVLVY